MITNKSFWLFIFLALAVTGCASGGSEPNATAVTFTGGLTAGDTETDGDSDGETDGVGDGICLLHNCSEDQHCASCTEGRNTCLVEEGRCVACDPGTGEGCPEGQDCSDYGYCVPEGLECPMQGDEPAVVCDADLDCAACDPQHLVCDTSSKQCVGCSADNTDHCQSTETCVDGVCTAKCPDSCTTDAECGSCGTGDHEAHACNAHQCSQCSDTVPCGAGETCNAHGVCVAQCGLEGQEAGVCDADSHCDGCPGDATECVKPINGGHGTCGPAASGCSDIGENVVVLPEPWDQVTNLCSNENDCNGVGIQFNIGKLLREITGLDEINDANIDYPMNECANVTVEVNDNPISCGVCVPCKVDADCEDIEIDPLLGDLFDIPAILIDLLLDQIFGPEERKVYMFCEPVAAGYGVCAPCPSLLDDCSNDGGGGGNGSCDHDVCSEGGPLKASCGACAANVCQNDPYCCQVQWDDICVQEVEEYCAGSCEGGGGCSHDVCDSGDALDESCSGCASQVCQNDPYCCQVQWDDVCVQQVADYCNIDCDNGGGGCGHSECDTGGPLQDGCSTCVSQVCAQDDYCCSVDWDTLCVDQAAELCGMCGGGGGCSHNECSEGAPLDENCSSCVGQVCGQDSYCCTTNWDSICVDLADELCGICGGGGQSCPHDECTTGGPLDPGCSSCVGNVCSQDSYCCEQSWDNVCVDLADQLCGTCGGGGQNCPHDECTTGAALDEGCTNCTGTVCFYDSYCCSTAWDQTCVDQAGQYCGLCGGGGGCAHDECVEGVALEDGCSACVDSVCGDDPYCCDVQWDSVCVDAADLYCGC